MYFGSLAEQNSMRICLSTLFSWFYVSAVHGTDFNNIQENGYYSYVYFS